MPGSVFDDDEETVATEPAPVISATPGPAPVPATPEPSMPPAAVNAATPAAMTAMATPATKTKAEVLLGNLFKRGRIIKVSIGCPEFRKKLTHKDLNKKKEDVPEEIVSLGQKRLIKKSALAEIKALQSQAYAIVDMHSHEAWIPGLRFMTEATAKKVHGELDELRKKYDTLADDFCKRYYELKEETLKEFPEWKDKLEPFYPSVERVRENFYFKVSGMDEFKITIVRDEAEILGEAKVQLENKLMGELDGFLKGSVLSARTQFVEALQGVQEKLKSGDKVNSRTIKKIHDMIEEAQSKDIVQDNDFFNMLMDFKKKFTPDAAKEENFKNEIEGGLQAILEAAGNASQVDDVVDKYKRSILV